MTTTILLYDLEQPALIVPWSTGLIYQNQTAGVGCNQREAPGALVPIPGYILTPAVLQMENREWLTRDDADNIDQSWLNHPDFVIRMTVDRDQLNQSEEAWIYVKTVLDWYAGTAILTWPNSD